MPAALPARVKLIKVNSAIYSSYSNSKGVIYVAETPMGFAPPDVAEAIWLLHVAVLKAGGRLRLTSLLRSRESSDKARAKYLQWKDDGKPDPDVKGSGYDKTIHKDAYVKPGGLSNHNGARAIDVHVTDKKDGLLVSIIFPSIHANQNLDMLWDLAIPLGFTPIIDAPNETQKEAWHLDFLGPWAHVNERLGADAGAMAACLDAGMGGYPGGAAKDRRRALQAQIHRCGPDIGKIDGDLGKKPRRGLALCGLPETTTDPAALFKIATLSKPSALA